MSLIDEQIYYKNKNYTQPDSCAVESKITLYMFIFYKVSKANLSYIHALKINKMITNESNSTNYCIASWLRLI